MSAQPDLLPCPFCPKGTTEIRENRLPGAYMDGSVRLRISVEVCHWCEPVEGQPRRRSIVMVGRDHASAVAAWNTRAAPSAARDALDILANTYCTCGGRGPLDADACGCCKIWHAARDQNAAMRAALEHIAEGEHSHEGPSLDAWESDRSECPACVAIAALAARAQEARKKGVR